MGRFVFGAADRHIAYRPGVARHGFQPLGVVPDHDIRFDLGIAQPKMREKQLQGRAALRLVHDRDRLLRSADLDHRLMRSV